jgi:hypothetical protein
VPDYVRVATFETDSNGIDMIVNEINSADGPPPGVPSKSIMVVGDRETGKVRVVVRFGSEEDLRTGSATLDGMEPPPEAGMRRTGVETFEVLLERDAP